MLVCSRRCGSRLFRALFAEVELDSEGVYQDHRIAQPGYICLNCGAPAFDLGEVPAEMRAGLRNDGAGRRGHGVPELRGPARGRLKLRPR